MLCLDQPPTRPVEILRCSLKPTNELISPDFDPLIRRLYFGLLSINEFPLLFLDSDQTFFQLVRSENNVKRNLIFLRCGKLSRQLGLLFSQEICLKTRSE